MKYFDNIKNFLELKKCFRKLALKYHPDKGGTNEQMKEINKEYEELLKILKSNLDAKEKTVNHHEIDDGFREIILHIINYENIEIELIGTWIWISGNTFPISNKLREIGFIFSNSKKKWYWRNAEDKNYFSRGNKSIYEIRRKYGSVIVDKGKEQPMLKVINE